MERRAGPRRLHTVRTETKGPRRITEDARPWCTTPKSSQSPHLLSSPRVSGLGYTRIRGSTRVQGRRSLEATHRGVSQPYMSVWLCPSEKGTTSRSPSLLSHGRALGPDPRRIARRCAAPATHHPSMPATATIQPVRRLCKIKVEQSIPAPASDPPPGNPRHLFKRLGERPCMPAGPS